MCKIYANAEIFKHNMWSNYAENYVEKKSYFHLNQTLLFTDFLHTEREREKDQRFCIFSELLGYCTFSHLFSECTYRTDKSCLKYQACGEKKKKKSYKNFGKFFIFLTQKSVCAISYKSERVLLWEYRKLC